MIPLKIFLMKNRKTPQPGSKEYDVENTQNLNMPEFNSSTDRRESSEWPSVENLDHQYTEKVDRSENFEIPKTNLGNERDDDEEEKERLITP